MAAWADVSMTSWGVRTREYVPGLLYGIRMWVYVLGVRTVYVRGVRTWDYIMIRSICDWVGSN